MADEEKSKEEIFDELKDKKEKDEQENVKKSIATRKLIERDYEEDMVKVTFETSPETKRTIIAKRPTNKEMMAIMKLSAEARKFEEEGSTGDLLETYKEISEIAAKLSKDNDLDRDFWNESISFTTLMNFISELLNAETGEKISEEEMKSFRKQ